MIRISPHAQRIVHEWLSAAGRPMPGDDALLAGSSWPEFAALLDGIRSCAGEASMREIGRSEGLRRFALPEVRAWSSGKGTLELYEHAALAILPSLISGLDASSERANDGCLAVWLDLPGAEGEGLADLFELLAGFAEAIPLLRDESVRPVELWVGPSRASALLLMRPRATATTRIESEACVIENAEVDELERKQLSGLMEQSSDLMALCALTGELLSLNTAGRALLGLPDEAASCDSFFDFFTAASQRQLRREVMSIVSQKARWSGELQILDSTTGQATPVTVSLFLLENPQHGRPPTLAAICRDVRAERRSFHALHDSERRLQMLSEGSFDLICEIDGAGRVVYVSPNCRALLGYDPEDLLGSDGFALVHPDEHASARAGCAEVIAGGESAIQMARFRNAEGGYRSMEATVSAYRTTAGDDRVLIVMRDLSERTAVEETLRETEERLRQSQKMEAVGRLAGGIAHDFNNLLTAITGHTDLLIEDLGEDHPSLPDALEVLSASRRAAALTRQLLAFSRRQVLQPRVIDLNSLVSELDRMLRRVIGEHYELICALDGGLWPVLADPGQVEQVLMNLLVNARDAMPHGGRIRVETRNHHLEEAILAEDGIVPPADYVALSVRDWGSGMDSATRERIFEPFFTTKAAGAGTGLGLSTVLGIVQQSEGHLSVRSTPGRGSEFTVLLPRALRAITTREPAAERVDPRGDATVLVVEDEEAVRRLVAHYLRSHGYEVLEASGVDEALGQCHCHSGPIDLLLTDVVLPKLDGPGIAAHVRELRPEIVVLYMSGFTDDSLETHGVHPGDVTLLSKPFTRSVLLQCVSNVLQRNTSELGLHSS